MKKLFIGTALVAALGLSACTANTTNPTNYYDYTAAAMQAHEKAKAHKNVWKQKKMKKSYVDTYLAKASKADDAGKTAEALKYAKMAYKTANAELAQSENIVKAGWEK